VTNRREFLLGFSLSALIVANPSMLKAWTHGRPGPTGTAVLNGFNSVNSGEYPYKNFMLGAPQPANRSGTFAFPTALDDKGFPLANASPTTADISCGAVPLPPSWAGNWILGWVGQGKFLLNNPNGMTIVQGASFVSGGTTGGILAVGTNGRIVFSMGAGATQTNFPFYFETDTANSFDGTLTKIYLCRDNGATPGGATVNGGDEADILSGDLSRMFNNDFITDIATLNPCTLRVMDFCNTNNSNVSKPYSLRRAVDSFSYGTTTTTGVGSQWLASLWAGAITTASTDNYTCGAAPSAPVSWTHGETFQGQFGGSAANASYAYSTSASGTGGVIRLTMSSTTGLTTGQAIANGFGRTNGSADGTTGNWLITVVDSTHIELTTNLKTGQPSVFTVANGAGAFTAATINVNNRGRKLMIWGNRGGGGSLNFGGALVNNAITTLSYDADFDAVWVSTDANTVAGLSNGPPIEVVVALCNKLNMGLWYCFPAFTTDAEVTSMAAYIYANLRQPLHNYSFFEWANEVWNTGFCATGMAMLKGLCLSNGTAFVPSSGQNLHGYYGLRVVQVMNLVKAAMPTARRVMACQAYGGVAVTQPVNVYRLKGTDLTPSGNAVYSASSISGGVNYTAAPNRPIDVCTDLAYAPYFQGAQLADGNAVNQNYDNGTLAGISGTGQLLWQADKYVNGNPTEQAAALAWADNDLRIGTYAPIVVTSNNYPTTPFTFSFATSAMFGYPKPLFDGAAVFLTVSGGTLPGGLSTGTAYYIKSSTATSMQLAATPTGAAISPSSAGTGTVSINIAGRGTLYSLDTGDVDSGVLGGGFTYGIFPAFETIAKSYDSSRTTNSLPLLKVSCYEGGPQPINPTAATLARLGDASSVVDDANIQALLAGYKSNDLFRQLMLDSLKRMMGTDSASANFGLLTHSSHPCHYTFGSGSQWALYSGDLYAAKWKSFDGFKQFNGN
jgi:hypothetical protein